MAEARARTASGPKETTRRGGVGAWARGLRLSTKLIALTALFVIVSEILVFVPSIAHFRVNRLNDMLVRAELVAMALENSPDVGRALQDRLLAEMDASAIAVRSGQMRRLVAMAQQPPIVDRVVDLGTPAMWRQSFSGLETLFAGDGRTIRVLSSPDGQGRTIDLVMSETPIRQAMVRFSVNLVIISALMLMIVAVVTFFVLRNMYLRPLARISGAMAAFAEAPEDPERIIRPSARGDEIGDAERRLAALQHDLSGALAQQKHLADLGVAVSKINHDLRNMLASAQLVTDRLSSVQDAGVQRFVPKLVATLDRAIAYSRAVLDYGKTGEAPPERRLISVRRLMEDVGELAGAREGADGLVFDDGVKLTIEVPPGLEVDADPDQIFRVMLNLVRNARQAFEGDDDRALVKRITLSGERRGTVVTLRVRDTGPGVPARARDKLFRAFQGGVRAGGTGLGLAICAELARAHGGAIALVEDGPGATFEVTIPDRVIDLSRVERRQSQHH